MNTLCRNRHLHRLEQQEFDLLVIGGGATGAGIALDAASRGLSVALVDRGDFSCGTSSRSSKLIHGGVRYLEAAVTRLDPAQWRLVREALRERAILLATAPHLVQPLRTLVPAYSWYQLARYRSGLWLYDRAAGRAMIAPSRFLTPRQLLAVFPQLKSRNLKGGVAYYDASFNDARMAITLLLTAVKQGATIANYLEVTGFTHSAGRLDAALVSNRLNGQQSRIRARVMINATGVHGDHLRQLEDRNSQPLLVTSRGSHIVLDQSWTGSGDALLIPATRDGRVLFVLPWLQHTLVGTTDVTAPILDNPVPDSSELDYLLEHLEQWLERPVKREQILASWSGLRPLLAEGHSTSTARVVREHRLETGCKGLLSVLGGKWTTYRKMAEQAVDHAIAVAGLKPSHGCHTEHLLLLGSEGYDPALADKLAQDYQLDEDVARHLAHAYGTRADELLGGASTEGRQRLLGGQPYLRAEVSWARRQEMAMTAEDILQRRLRIGFLDQQAAGRLAADPLLQQP